jgi:tetratricopeptide (TPR) repeat protein
VARFQSLFSRFGLATDNEKRAALLCRRGESEVFAGNVDMAEMLFREATELAPHSAYVHALRASYELTRNRLDAALACANEACGRATQKTGALAYTVAARVFAARKDRTARVAALEKALTFAPDDTILRHQYGVALSQVGQTEQAIREFDRIIDEESARVPPRESLPIALRTRIINLRRLGRLQAAESDLLRAKQIVQDNPHLRDQMRYLEDLDEGD